MKGQSIMVQFGGQSARALSPAQFTKSIKSIASTLGVFGEQAKVMVKVSTYGGAIDGDAATRARVAQLQTPSTTRRSSRKKSTSRRSASPRKYTVTQKVLEARRARKAKTSAKKNGAAK